LKPTNQSSCEKLDDLPSGNRLQKTIENHNFLMGKLTISKICSTVDIDRPSVLGAEPKRRPSSITAEPIVWTMRSFLIGPLAVLDWKHYEKLWIFHGIIQY
jgi:hypothetical protein